MHDGKVNRSLGSHMLSRPAWPDHAVVAVALTYLGKDGFRKSSFRKLKTDCTNETVVYVTVFLL